MSKKDEHKAADLEQLLASYGTPAEGEKEGMRAALIARVNELILNDFNKLVQILYRVDVSENKLKAVLKQSPHNDAAELITDLLIERQLEKKKGKNEHDRNDPISEDERWI